MLRYIEKAIPMGGKVGVVKVYGLVQSGYIHKRPHK
jgi:hypothetical protein